MNILLAPDKFKGSLSARQVCDALREGLSIRGDNLRVIAIPMADGGEGTCELLTEYSGGTPVKVRVRDPLFREITSGYGISKDGRTAFLEMATASGLQLLAKTERNPLLTTTAGTGDLIRHALENGVQHIIMGIGGSGTNDGGMGMADSLGVKFYSVSGQRLSPVGKSMADIHRVDLADIHPRLQQVAFTIFCDVDNPLYGPRGAAYVFAPQKGADIDMVKELDHGLSHYKKVMEESVIRQLDFPGAGAGGGLPASLMALANITIRRGMDFIIEYTGLEAQVENADVVITGEGKVDEQTLSGKVVKGLADLARKYKKPLFIVAGRNELDAEQLLHLGGATVITLMNGEIPEEVAVADAFQLIRQRVKEEIIPLFL